MLNASVATGSCSNRNLSFNPAISVPAFEFSLPTGEFRKHFCLQQHGDSRKVMQERILNRPILVDDMITNNESGGMEFILWLTSIGKSRTVGWAWRKKGWIVCYRIGRTLFISSDEIARFWRRAAGGEFDGPTPTP